MALHPSHSPWRRAAAVVTVGVFALTGCGADDTAAGDTSAGGGAAPAAVSPSTSTAEQEPIATAGDAAGASPAPVEPPAQAATEGSAPAAVEEPAQEFVITIADFAYEVPDTVPPGSTITVVNNDSEAHTVTSSGDFDVAVTSGESATFPAPQEPGEYTISCLLHGNMTATLVVA